MKVAIVYETHTGTTSAAAEEMAQVVRAAGHECTAESISNAQPAKINRADAIVIGCWTKGWFIIRQHPSDGIADFVDQLTLNGKPTAVFITYKIAAGSTLRMLAAHAEAAGGKVTGMYQVKGPKVPDGFEAWVGSLGSDAAL